MRVAFLVNRFPVVSQTFIADQVLGMIDRGVDVQIFPASVDASSQSPLLRTGTDLAERTHAREEPGEGTLSVKLRSIGRLTRLASASPRVARRVMTPPTSADSRGGPGTVARMALPFLRRGEFDVLHAHFGPLGLDAVTVRTVMGWTTPVVTSFHGYDISRFVRQNGSDVYEPLFERGDLFLPVTERWRDRLVELGCPPERIRVHRMGIDLDAFPFRPREATPPFQILSVARVVEKKGIEYGIRAVAQLIDSGIKCHYTILGDGPLRDELEELSRDLGVVDWIEFRGAVPRRVVVRELASAHALLVPSVTSSDGDEEGLPVVLMEAMASGVPVVASDHSGIPELVMDGVTGNLAAEGDANDLGLCLEGVLTNPVARDRVMREGRRIVEEQHDLERLNDDLAEIYRDL